MFMSRNAYLAIVILAMIWTQVLHAGVVYSGAQDLVLEPGQYTGPLEWAGPAIAFSYTVEAVEDGQRGRVSVHLYRDGGKVLVHNGVPALLCFGHPIWRMDAMHAPGMTWGYPDAVILAEWTGNPATGEWTGWQGVPRAGADVFMAAMRFYQRIGWLRLRFGDSFNNGASEVLLVDGAYNTETERGILAGTLNTVWLLPTQWPDTQRVSDRWYYSERMGWFMAEPAPWGDPDKAPGGDAVLIWRPQKHNGWEYWLAAYAESEDAGEPSGQCYVWTPALGWMTTDPDTYPWCYVYAVRIEGFRNPKQYWLDWPAAQYWIPVPDGSSFIDFFGTTDVIIKRDSLAGSIFRRRHGYMSGWTIEDNYRRLGIAVFISNDAAVTAAEYRVNDVAVIIERGMTEKFGITDWWWYAGSSSSLLTTVSKNIVFEVRHERTFTEIEDLLWRTMLRLIDYVE
jgi:hypothetical protein